MRHFATTLAGAYARPFKHPLLAALALAATLLAPLAHADQVILLVDNSGSMRANDAERLVPSAVLGFVRDLPDDTEVAVVAFDASARLLAPLTPARDFDASVLDRLDYRGQLTDPAAAVERGLYELRDHTATGTEASAMVLITDGVIDLGSAEASLRAEDWLLRDLSEQLVEQDIRVWAIALTDAADFRMLSRLTSATQGRYFRALAARDVAEAINRIGVDLEAMTPAPVPVTDTVSTATVQAPAPAAPRQDAQASAAPSGAGQETAVEARAATPARATATDAPMQPEVATSAARSPLTQDTASDLRWWLAFAFLAIGVGLLAWVSISSWRDRRRSHTTEEPALEYFPDCYLVDLHGVTDRPTHRLASKYNMVTRLQNPPDDGINYIQVFRRQIGRRHALIEYRDFSFWIIDQNSLNGTFMNGERLQAETRLKHGDRLRFHIYEFEFCVSDLALSNETLVEQERAAAR